MVTVVPQNKIFSRLKGYGGRCIARIFHGREIRRGRVFLTVYIEKAVRDLYRISRQGSDTLDDITAQVLSADDHNVSVIQILWQTEFPEQDRLAGSVGWLHGGAAYEIQLHYIVGQKITDAAGKQYKKKIRTGSAVHRTPF